MATELKNEELLVAWLEKEDILFRLSREEAGKILGYLDGSGYSLEVEGGILYLYDYVNDTKEGITFDDAVDRVCEANYELIEETVTKIANADMDADTLKQEQYLSGLIRDEKLLDRVFQQTKYQREINKNVKLLTEEKQAVSAGISR